MCASAPQGACIPHGIYYFSWVLVLFQFFEDLIRAHAACNPDSNLSILFLVQHFRPTFSSKADLWFPDGPLTHAAFHWYYHCWLYSRNEVSLWDFILHRLSEVLYAFLMLLHIFPIQPVSGFLFHFYTSAELWLVLTDGVWPQVLSLSTFPLFSSMRLHYCTSFGWNEE